MVAAGFPGRDPCAPPRQASTHALLRAQSWKVSRAEGQGCGPGTGREEEAGWGREQR